MRRVTGVGGLVLCFVVLSVLVDLVVVALVALWRWQPWAAGAVVTLWLPVAVLGVMDIIQRRRVLPPRASWFQRLAWLSAALWPLSLLGALSRWPL